MGTIKVAELSPMHSPNIIKQISIYFTSGNNRIVPGKVVDGELLMKLDKQSDFRPYTREELRQRSIESVSIWTNSVIYV